MRAWIVVGKWFEGMERGRMVIHEWARTTEIGSEIGQ